MSEILINNTTRRVFNKIVAWRDNAKNPLVRDGELCICVTQDQLAESLTTTTATVQRRLRDLRRLGGREALSQLLQSRAEVARLVTEVLPRSKRMRAIQGLLFDVEGGVCTLEVTDPFHDRLKAVTEGRWSGLPRDQIADGLRLMRTAIPELNDFRKQVWGS